MTIPDRLFRQRDSETPTNDRDQIDHPLDDEYVGTMNRLIDKAIDYMGQDRAVELANSGPIRVDDDGEIQAFQFGETEESKRAVTELVLEAYIQVVGRQLVLDMLEESASGRQLRSLERLCPSDEATDRASAK